MQSIFLLLRQDFSRPQQIRLVGEKKNAADRENRHTYREQAWQNNSSCFEVIWPFRIPRKKIPQLGTVKKKKHNNSSNCGLMKNKKQGTLEYLNEKDSFFFLVWP